MAMTTGVVLVRTGSSYRVYTDAGEVTAVLRGKLRRRDDDRIVAGDVVELALQPDGPATISRVRPRRRAVRADSQCGRGGGRGCSAPRAATPGQCRTRRRTRWAAGERAAPAARAPGPAGGAGRRRGGTAGTRGSPIREGRDRPRG